MLPSDLSKVDDRLLSQLCEDEAGESQNLDFKMALPGKGEASKTEFAKDVCAFANADGGDIVFGIADNQGKAGRVCPIELESADAARRRLIQTIDRLIEPRIIGTQFHEVPFGSMGFALVVRVPQSFDGPHRFATEGAGNRFVIRVGTVTQDLTYQQLRGAFDRTATLAARARQFRSDRIDRIKSGQTWRPLRHGVKWVVHLMPVASMAGRTKVDVQSLNAGPFAQFGQRGWGGATRRLNLDGIVIYPPIPNDEERALSYVQVFRSGAFEAVRFGGRLVDDKTIIPGGDMSVFIREMVQKFIDGTRAFGISGPAILGVAVLDTSGYGLGIFDRRAGFERVTDRADRGDLVVPEAWIENLEAFGDVDEIVRPVLDILYQSFDVERCYEYDESGKWLGG